MRTAIIVLCLASLLLWSCYKYDNPLDPDNLGEHAVPAMITVQGGTFNNGTSDVTLSSFQIGKYEVTQAEYISVMGNNPAFDYGVGSSNPVYYVSWFRTIEFCNRLSMQEGLTPCYSYSTYGTNPDSWPVGWNTINSNHADITCNWAASGYRLPTEMEWMFAARGGNQTLNYTYSGSNAIEDVAWYESNSGSSTHTVGTKLPNELGIYDMSGNVLEFCWDIWGFYPSEAQNNPTGADSGTGHVARGGCFGYDAIFCTVSYRDISSLPMSSYNYSGFRVCRNSP